MFYHSSIFLLILLAILVLFPYLKVPITFMQTLQKYDLLKTPLNKEKEPELLKELREKLKNDKTIKRAIINSDKAKKYKDLIIQKLAYIKENKILTLNQYKEAYGILEQVLGE